MSGDDTTWHVVTTRNGEIVTATDLHGEEYTWDEPVKIAWAVVRCVQMQATAMNVVLRVHVFINDEEMQHSTVKIRRQTPNVGRTVNCRGTVVRTSYGPHYDTCRLPEDHSGHCDPMPDDGAFVRWMQERWQ